MTKQKTPTKKKKRKQKKKQLYFRDKQKLIPSHTIYFERNKFNKSISNEIAQILPCIVKKKHIWCNTHARAHIHTQNKINRIKQKDWIGKSNGLARRWTETNIAIHSKTIFFIEIPTLSLNSKFSFLLSFFCFKFLACTFHRLV